MNSTQIGACAQASSDIIKRLGLVGKYVSSRDYRTGANLCRLCKDFKGARSKETWGRRVSENSSHGIISKLDRLIIKK